MSTSTVIAIYFLIWWLTLFAVLPWGVRAQGDEGAAGTDPGAPAVANLKPKLVWTTMVASMIFAALNWVLVKPMQRLTRNMVTFGQNPEDFSRIIVPSPRHDEIGVAEIPQIAAQANLPADPVAVSQTRTESALPPAASPPIAAEPEM